MKVKKIEYIGIRNVYDIEVDDNENFFISNNILSHNSEVKNCVEGSDDLLLINELPSMTDRAMICDQLKRDKRISDQQIAYIAMMPIEQMAVVCRGEKAKLVKKVQPPRNQPWKQGDGDFSAEWKKVYNNYKKIAPEVEEIEDNYKERLDLLLMKRQSEERSEQAKKFAPEGDFEEDSEESEESETPDGTNSITPEDEIIIEPLAEEITIRDKNIFKADKNDINMPPAKPKPTRAELAKQKLWEAFKKK